MLETHSETVKTDSGASVEVATVTFGGRDFTNMGSVVDHENGFVVCYPDKDGHVTTWNGVVLGTASLVRKWKQFVPFACHRVEIYAWSCVIDGRKYHGRNSGPGMLLRLRASK